ncbi:MAG TPA: TraR/DksA C4-type zinc finger protein [Pyrinomonadaceae bacterium]|nr:TraR/DksA C4-type zinc finger protein [Pyrinomonadaceae bacterium]
MENAVIELVRTSGPVWNQLQQLKEEVVQELAEDGPWIQTQPDASPDERPLVAEIGAIDWIHRSQLEARLRDITEAQDRLLDSQYGKCIECGDQISAARLAVDPAASLCLFCKGLTEPEHVYSTL